MSGPAPPDCFFPGDRCLQLDIGAARTPALSQRERGRLVLRQR
jgi:hypothetical protein